MKFENETLDSKLSLNKIKGLKFLFLFDLINDKQIKGIYWLIWVLDSIYAKLRTSII